MNNKYIRATVAVFFDYGLLIIGYIISFGIAYCIIKNYLRPSIGDQPLQIFNHHADRILYLYLGGRIVAREVSVPIRFVRKKLSPKN